MTNEGRRGQSTGKISELQTLCKLWLMEVRRETGDDNAVRAPSAMPWDKGFLTRKEWVEETQTTTRRQDMMTWGRIVGIHFGEENALAAMQRNEVKKIANPDFKKGCTDQPEFYYKMASMIGPLGA